MGFTVAGLASGQARAADDASALEEIVVTGTRIVRPDFVSASPILSIAEQRFEQTASATVDDVLNGLPQFVPSFGSTSNNPSNGGQANLSLRGLPPTATLVLLDGRRLMPANGSGVTDVNIIPPSLIESVEVITGGASAVYGSDAIAGVVNFKLRHEFDGVQLDAMGGVTDHGDGEDYAFGLSAGTGFADGRGSVMGYAGYYDRNLLTYADRDFSRYALNFIGAGAGTLGPKNAFVPVGSTTIEEGRARLVPSRSAFDGVFETYGYAPGTVPYSQTLPGGRTAYNRDFGINLDGTVFTMGLLPMPVQGGVANFRGPRDPVTYNGIAYGYNFATLNALQLPLERTSLFGRAEFEFSESARLYAQALYADYSVSMQLAPTPVSGLPVPATNPWIPADLRTLLDSRANPDDPFELYKRMTALGPRISEEQYDVYQATVGLDGRLAGDWRYDAYLQIGRNRGEERQSNNVRRSRFLDLVGAADGGVALCGGYDPFGNKPISADCAAYIAVDGTNRTTVEQRVAEVSASGPVFGLPAGDVQLALGAMYKSDEYRYRADPISQSFLPDGNPEVIGFNAADDIDGDDHNTDLYFEASLPLLSDVRGAESLEAVLGYRWSDYASAGSVDAYKAELLYRPVSAVRIRGSFQHAVRAPSVYELYLPQLGPDVQVDLTDPDPCSVSGAARNGPDAARVEALCVAQGMPAALLPTYEYAEETVQGVAGGNPDLDAEQADTVTAGVVFTSKSTNRWLANLQFSVDWYRIEVDDAIAIVPATDFVPRCYDARFNPDFSADNAYCTYFGRDGTTGEIRDAREIYRNIGLFRTSGVDLQVDWSAEAGPGRVAINWLVGYVDTFEQSGGPGIAAEELVGLAGGGVGAALPEWKWNLRASYAVGGLEATLQWRWIDSMQDRDQPDWTVPSVDYYDLYVGYAIDAGPLAGLTLNAGAENLTDESPPIFPSYVQANTDPSQYDTLGRRYFARLTYRF